MLCSRSKALGAAFVLALLAGCGERATDDNDPMAATDETAAAGGPGCGGGPAAAGHGGGTARTVAHLRRFLRRDRHSTLTKINRDLPDLGIGWVYDMKKPRVLRRRRSWWTA